MSERRTVAEVASGVGHAPTQPPGDHVGASVVHLFSVLSNFESVQVLQAHGGVAGAESARQSRADLQQQAHELHAQLVGRYAAGETVKSLAAAHGLHHQTVRTLLVEAGAIVRTRQRLAQADIEQIVRLYEGGATTTELGEHFGVYASTIQRQLKRVGIPLRPASRRPNDNRD